MIHFLACREEAQWAVPKGWQLDAGMRFLWGKDERGARRPVMPGDYQVWDCSIVRLGATGAEWRTWTSGKGREVTVPSVGETRLDLNLNIMPNAMWERTSAGRTKSTLIRLSSSLASMPVYQITSRPG